MSVTRPIWRGASPLCGRRGAGSAAGVLCRAVPCCAGWPSSTAHRVLSRHHSAPPAPPTRPHVRHSLLPRLQAAPATQLVWHAQGQATRLPRVQAVQLAAERGQQAQGEGGAPRVFAARVPACSPPPHVYNAAARGTHLPQARKLKLVDALPLPEAAARLCTYSKAQFRLAFAAMGRQLRWRRSGSNVPVVAPGTERLVLRHLLAAVADADAADAV